MGVSIIGAVCHNMAQIAVAAFVVKTTAFTTMFQCFL